MEPVVRRHLTLHAMLEAFLNLLERAGELVLMMVPSWRGRLVVRSTDGSRSVGELGIQSPELLHTQATWRLQDNGPCTGRVTIAQIGSKK